MHALVVYESMFGNTKAIAEAIAEGLAGGMRAEVAEVASAPVVVGEDVCLLVVGGPTHAFGLSRVSTRQSAAEQAKGAPLVSQGRGVREWLGALRTSSATLGAAAFDTRVAKPRMPGSAARAVARRLRRAGVRLAGPAQSFYVDGVRGPLLPGELERAREWGESLAAAHAVPA
ncbi:flavodoxin domain-containing protein [Actinomadura sp. ATCC 31491]|uniref:Flavodoxin domain-containing protein n=1 Tax=Actinomadura luzonensis TaxID=2805427 RepID=A0ABT0FUW5_9ACTN|nr:flavodoxin domain-containing protein [Actinomadura luzonensis]MCK2216122.1 flavodoxin domain-containing protein [Actinomadura luzonensis]